jgi:hypothetical protein
MKQERATFLVYLWERTDASNVKKQSVWAFLQDRSTDQYQLQEAFWEADIWGK